MNPISVAKCNNLWLKLVKSEAAFYAARTDLFAHCRSELVHLVKGALDGPGQRITALGIAALLSVEERQLLLDRLLSLACFTHGLTTQARDIVLSLPKQWLLANIEHVAEPLLQHDDYEQYAGILQIYVAINADLASQLARRAAIHPNADIREIGERFLAVKTEAE